MGVQNAIHGLLTRNVDPILKSQMTTLVAYSADKLTLFSIDTLTILADFSDISRRAETERTEWPKLPYAGSAVLTLQLVIFALGKICTNVAYEIMTPFYQSLHTCFADLEFNISFSDGERRGN